MPAVVPLSADVVDEINEILPIGYDLIKAAPDAAPEQVLKAVETVIYNHRDGGDELDQDSMVALGLVVGDQYVRTLGWSWVQLQYEDDAEGDGPFAVVNARKDTGNQPMNWVYEIATDADREIGILLNFTMIRTGAAQGGQPGDPMMFH